MSLNKKEIKISSDPLNLDQVEIFVKGIFTLLSLGSDLYLKVLLCLNEAVYNSISHGNRFDANKNVLVQSYFCKKYLFFRIIDEGSGFDYSNLPDPTTEENLVREEGRGIFLIKNISDGIYFREKGNIMEFKIKIDAQN